MPAVNNRTQLMLLLNAVTRPELTFQEREAAAKEIYEQFDPKRHAKLFVELLKEDDLTDPAREMLIDILSVFGSEEALVALEAFVKAAHRSYQLRNEVYLRLVALGRIKLEANA